MTTITAEQVQAWFKAATKRFAPPPLQDCELIAVQLAALGRRAEYQRPRDERAASAAEVTRYGKLFLHHLKSLREEIRAAVADANYPTQAEAPIGASPSPLPWRRTAEYATESLEGDPRRAVWKLTLAQIETAGREVEELLMYLEGLPRPGEHPVRALAAAAQAAWAAANDGKWPTGANPDDPVVRFVVSALAAIGQDKPPATVGDILRGRGDRKGRGRG
jgi:hypothetical protein